MGREMDMLFLSLKQNLKKFSRKFVCGEGCGKV